MPKLPKTTSIIKGGDILSSEKKAPVTGGKPI
jgi:hypothetical protein